jgi:hypothetical protein
MRACVTLTMIGRIFVKGHEDFFFASDFVNVCEIRRCYRTPFGTLYALLCTVSGEREI